MRIFFILGRYLDRDEEIRRKEAVTEEKKNRET